VNGSHEKIISLVGKGGATMEIGMSRKLSINAYD
jgi:hypothetical protein